MATFFRNDRYKISRRTPLLRFASASTLALVLALGLNSAIFNFAGLPFSLVGSQGPVFQSLQVEGQVETISPSIDGALLDVRAGTLKPGTETARGSSKLIRFRSSKSRIGASLLICPRDSISGLFAGPAHSSAEPSDLFSNDQ